MKKALLGFLIILTIPGIFAQNGVITEITGTVELKLPGASVFIPAAAGSIVNQNTIISTGFKSTALVEIGSTLIMVRALTRLTLTEIVASQGIETLNVNLQAGRVKVDVNPPAGTRVQTQISSPVATASVRGTSAELDTRSIRVIHGSVSYGGNRGMPRMVSTGNTSAIGSDGKAADPVKARRERLKPRDPAGSGESVSRETSVYSSRVLSVELNYRTIPPREEFTH